MSRPCIHCALNTTAVAHAVLCSSPQVFPASVTLGPGETQELTCEASGGSGLQINWFVGAEARQGQQFALNEVVVSYLLISTPGLYQCVVLGASGFASANITVTARG